MAHPGGRPTDYTPELGDLICEKVATHTIGTNKLCDMYDDIPSENTIYKWRYKHPEFREKYTLAKQYQAELMAEKLREMCHVDTFIDKDGIERVDGGKVMLQRLKVDTIKWEASKLAPKLYGDKTQNDTDTKIGALMEEIKDVKELANKCLKSI